MTGILLQARTGSTRLPQKMILPFYDNKGILEIIMQRLKDANLNIPIVLATTDNCSDNILEDIAKRNEILVFRGSESNVLNRFIKAAEHFKFEKIVRVCADNPFLDMVALKKQIELVNNSEFDYVCYSLSNNTPTIKTHYGFWTEGVKLSALKKIESRTNDLFYLEHVTNFIYTNYNYFSIHYEKIDKKIEIAKDIRLTIDTIEDFNLGKKLYSQLSHSNIQIRAELIVDYIKNNRTFVDIMRQQIQRNTK